MQGKVDQIRGRVRQLWGDITDDDIDRSKGSLEMLVGTIKEKTGESTESIKEKLSDLFDGEDVSHKDRQASHGDHR
jgi:uncharacterized protein YjbJ (UPF0337 family)